MIAEQVRPFQSEDHTPNQGNPEEPPVAVPKAAGCGVHKEEHRHHRNIGDQVLAEAPNLVTDALNIRIQIAACHATAPLPSVIRDRHLLRISKGDMSETSQNGSAGLNRPAPSCLDLLLSRRSGSAKAMTGPGPSPDQLRLILACGARVPDHGKLAPWRFILFEDDARARMGDLLVEAVRTTEPDVSAERLTLERGRFLRAPVVIGVISRVREGTPIPEWEQILSAGACCMSMVIAAHALGFVANWITEWYAFHPLVRERLGLKPGERVAGFIYIGKPAAALQERVRPDVDSLITRF
jgi:nitroreductase